MDLSELQVQAILMRWTLDSLNHIAIAPNITVTYWWECDALSVTRALFTHEFEIKRTTTDYAADAQKKSKHHTLQTRGADWMGNFPRIPNYFWYVVTFPTSIEIPEYAGHIQITHPTLAGVKLIKSAPRLHNQKLPQKKLLDIYRIATYRMKRLYAEKYLNGS